MAKLTTLDVISGYASTTALNNNFALVEAALENTLSRDGTTPNSMSADLDMNGNGILNVGDMLVGGIGLTASVTAAAASASAASVSASASAISAAAALASESAASASASAASLDAAVVADWDYIGGWITATPYLVNNIVYNATLGDSYICLVAHTSGTFATDYGAGKWGLLALHATATGTAGDMLKADNLFGLADTAVARVNLGVQIGADVQAYDSDLTSIAALTTTAFGRSLLTPVDAAAARTLLGAGTVTSVSGTAPIVSSGGTTPAISIPAATASVAGYMTSAYATKLDGIAVGATVGLATDAGASGVGIIALMKVHTGAGIVSGGTVAGGNIQYVYFDSTGTLTGAASGTGTWRNITGSTIGLNSSGTFQKVA